jgi:hypothetical protein
VTPEQRIIPFDTYNLFYRDGTDRRIRRELGWPDQAPTAAQ